MAIKVSYALREATQNLWRNVFLTVATVITVGVSLFLFGGFVLFQLGVDNATQRWEGGIEFVVWMQPDATPEQDLAIRTAIDESPEIRDWTYVDQEAAYEEFKEIFADSPELIDVVTPDKLPPSYRIVPVDPDADVVEELGRQFEGRPGVRDVVFAGDTIKEIQRQADRIGLIFFVGSLLLLGAATLLILTTLVIAINSRRQEIEIMKVVGATNWFIRIPFMLEGLVQGLAGAVGAVIATYFLNAYVIEGFSETSSLQLLDGFRVTSSELFRTNLLLIGIAVGVAVIGSAVAVTRYLDA